MKLIRICGVGTSLAFTSHFYNSRSSEENCIQQWKGIFPAHVHASERSNKLHLQHVQVLFRHGARTTIEGQKGLEKLKNLEVVEWDRDVHAVTPPHLDVPFVLKCLNTGEVLQPYSYSLIHKGGCKGGDLTTKGHLEAEEFGKWLAKEYIAKHRFLCPVYFDNGSVRIRSTHTHRTVHTARGVIAGLYGKENIRQPIKIFTKKSEDGIMPNWTGCYNINKRLIYYWNLIVDGQKELNDLMGLQEGEAPVNFIRIHDIVSQREHHGLFVPDYLLEKQDYIADQAMTLIMNILGNNVNNLRPSVGHLVEVLCSEMEESTSGTNKQRLSLYATHDTTILCMQKVLGIFEGVWPGYVANIVFELHTDEDSGDHFVRLLFDREVLKIADGEEFVPLEQFLKMMEEYRVADWAEECGNNAPGAVCKSLF